MAGTEDGRSILDGGVSRARFLKLAGLGAGLSLFPGSLFPVGRAGAQTFGGPEILDPNGPYPIGLWWPRPRANLQRTLRRDLGCWLQLRYRRQRRWHRIREPAGPQCRLGQWAALLADGQQAPEDYQRQHQ